MNGTITRRLAIFGCSASALVGCAADRPVILDRQAMAGIKRIGLPTVGVPRSPDVRVQNGLSDQMAGFGLIGAIGSVSGSIVRGNRSDSLVRMMAARGFDPGPAFTTMLATDLGAKSFSVVPLAADPKRRFLPVVAAAPEYDAVLDCYIASYGFTALNDSDDAPFRPTVAVPVRLVANGGVVLMQDTVVISAPTAPAGAPVSTFRSFSDAEKDPAVAIDALRAAFEAAANGVVSRST